MVSKNRKSVLENCKRLEHEEYSPDRLKREWQNAHHRKRRKTDHVLGAVEFLGKAFCLRGEVELLANNKHGWEPYAAGCQLMAIREAISIDRIASDPNYTLGPVDPYGVRYLACLFFLGKLEASRYFLENVLPTTWTHRLRRPKESSRISGGELHRLEELHLPENFGPPEVLMYNYQESALDSMILSMSSQVFRVPADNVFDSNEFAPLGIYSQLVDSPNNLSSVSECLSWMCNDRRKDHVTVRVAKVCTPAPLNVVPAEILFVQRTREVMGLPLVTIKDELLEEPFDQLPGNIGRYTAPLFEEVCAWVNDQFSVYAKALLS